MKTPRENSQEKEIAKWTILETSRVERSPPSWPEIEVEWVCAKSLKLFLAKVFIV